MSAVAAVIRVSSDRRRLHVTWDDGRVVDYDAEYLRVYSPSAEVRGHGAAERRIPGGKHLVAIRGIEAVGAYAIRILFDDGHDTGIYSWDYLADLGAARDHHWADYLAALAERGLSRDP